MFKVSNKTFGANAMRELVAAVAGPREWGGRDRWFEKAARIAGLSYRQVRAVYYGEITDPENIAILKLKAAAGKYETQQLADQFDAWLWRYGTATRIFIARISIRCSSRLAHFAVWIAPELIERGTR